MAYLVYQPFLWAAVHEALMTDGIFSLERMVAYFFVSLLLTLSNPNALYRCFFVYQMLSKSLYNDMLLDTKNNESFISAKS